MSARICDVKAVNGRGTYKNAKKMLLPLEEPLSGKTHSSGGKLVLHSFSLQPSYGRTGPDFDRTLVPVASGRLVTEPHALGLGRGLGVQQDSPLGRSA